jgi:hypothetical protein
MNRVFFNEIRNLKPHIRRNFMLTDQQYDDQNGPVMLEDEWGKRPQQERIGHTNQGFGRSFAHETAMAHMDERLQPLGKLL